MRARARALTVAALLVLPSLASAQETAGRYAVRALGVKVGELVMTGAASETKYTVSSQFTTTGMVGAVAGVKFLLRATGARKGQDFHPRSYTEEMDTGERQSEASLSYSGGVARGGGEKAQSNRKYKVSDGQQRGAVDPLTGMFMVMRDQPADTLCNIRQKVFDGERLTELELGAPMAKGGQVVCEGQFRRLAGYSAEDLQNNGRFNLSVTYEPVGDLMRATRMRAETIYGPASIVRR